MKLNLPFDSSDRQRVEMAAAGVIARQSDPFVDDFDEHGVTVLRVWIDDEGERVAL